MRQRSIVQQTRAYALVIMIVLSAAILSEWTQLSGIRAELEDLSTRTSPLLSETGEFARISGDLRALSESVRAAADRDAIARARQNWAILFADLGVIAEAGAFPPNLRKTTQAMFDDLIAAQLSLLETRRRTSGSMSVAVSAVENLSRDIQGVTGLEALLGFFDSTTTIGSETARHRVDELLTIAEMKVSLARLSLLASGLGSAQKPHIERTRTQVIREVGVLASGIARLTDTTLQQNLARHLSEYTAAMISERGLVQAVQDQGEAQRHRDVAFRDFLALVDEVTQVLGQTSLAAADRFERAAHSTEWTIRVLLHQKLAMTLIIILLIAIFTWSVVEKGLISRLAALARHVRLLSQGDVATPIHRTGLDEVGEIEEAVERSRLTAAALTRSNEELERFAYAAAHDLRSPLRAVSDLVDWTREDYGRDLPDGAQQNLTLISGRISRLSQHLTALLHYARAGEADAELTAFDLTAFADELQQDFIAADGFHVTVSDTVGPFFTKATPVKTILLNLVTNAIKHHDRDTGRIALSAEAEEGAVLLQVEDDGPGIAPQHHARIFDLFQTLKGETDGASTGIGLALVLKLARALGGAVEVISNPKETRGTRFTVRLPHHGILNAAPEHSSLFLSRDAA